MLTEMGQTNALIIDQLDEKKLGRKGLVCETKKDFFHQDNAPTHKVA